MKLSDIEIAHSTQLKQIGLIAEKLLGERSLNYEDICDEMAKLPIGLIDEEKNKII